jgi:hypothetical protein
MGLRASLPRRPGGRSANAALPRYRAVLDLVLLAVLVTFSPVMLIPFYLFAHEGGPVASAALLAVNVAIMALGYAFLWQRWKALRTAPEGDGLRRSPIPKAGARRRDRP